MAGSKQEPIPWRGTNTARMGAAFHPFLPWDEPRETGVGGWMQMLCPAGRQIPVRAEDPHCIVGKGQGCHNLRATPEGRAASRPLAK